jgi:uncharacterized protein (DUF1330 family)
VEQVEICTISLPLEHPIIPPTMEFNRVELSERQRYPISMTGIWRDVMKRYLALGAVLLAGTVIGAAAVTGLHAQTKPSVFVIAEIDITDPEGYGNEFVPKAQAIKAAGFKFLAIGGVGAGAKPITSLEGTPPMRVTIQQWDSLDALKAWYNGKDYQEVLPVGRKYGTFRRYAVEGR